MKSKYTAMQDLDLSDAVIVGFNDCSVSIVGQDLVCSDAFNRAVVKYPFDAASRYKQARGLPENIRKGEYGCFEAFEIDYDDEDYFGEEEQPEHILAQYSFVSTMYFTIIIKHC